MATLNYNNRLEGYAGNSKSVLVVAYDASGNLMDITGYDAFFYMKKYPVTASSTLDVSTAHDSRDIANSSFLFNLSSSELSLAVGDYVYEIVIDDSSANRHTLVQDQFNLKNSLI